MPEVGSTTGTQKWDAEQQRNAALIIRVGQQMGMSRRDIAIGLITAMQESSLRNLHSGDRDSQGLFQQRPSQGWGTVAQVTDPVYATTKFFNTLKGVEGRDRMPLTQAAQAVQRSAYPDAYAKWEGDAKAFLQSMGGKGKITPSEVRTYGGGGIGADVSVGLANGGPHMAGGSAVSALAATTDVQAGAPGLAAPTAGAVPQTALRSFDSPEDYVGFTGGGAYGQKGVDNTSRAVVEYAKQFIGTPYVWGGTDLKTGVDCSGFVQAVYKQMGIDLPRVSYQQANAGKRIGLDQLRPGDLVGFNNSTRNNGADHIAIYVGNGKIIEAPRPGIGVRIRRLGSDEGDAWGVRLK